MTSLSMPNDLRRIVTFYFCAIQTLLLFIIIYYVESNDLSDTITRQQLRGTEQQNTDNVARLVLTV